jgi:hypothetical protein
LALIRSFLIDSGLPTALREASCAKFFALHTRTLRSPSCVGKMCGVEKFARIMRSNAKIVRATNPYFIGVFSISQMRVRDARVIFRKNFMRAPRAHSTRVRLRNGRRIHVSLSGHCFFRCAVVNEMRCASIRDAH